MMLVPATYVWYVHGKPAVGLYFFHLLDDNYSYLYNERTRFVAHINKVTYRRPDQIAMPLADGRAAFLEREDRNQDPHPFRRGPTWRRRSFHQPQLKESTRRAAEETTSN